MTSLSSCEGLNHCRWDDVGDEVGDDNEDVFLLSLFVFAFFISGTIRHYFTVVLVAIAARSYLLISFVRTEHYARHAGF